MFELEVKIEKEVEALKTHCKALLHIAFKGGATTVRFAFD